MTRPGSKLAVTLAALALVAAGCSSSDPDPQPTMGAGGATTAATSDSLAPAGSMAAEVTIDGAWIKAADSGMTAAFGTIENRGSNDATIERATSSVSPMMELHETVPDGAGGTTMRAKTGGFVLPAQGSMQLQPGGDHIMLMGLTSPVKSGTTVDITLVFSDGSSLPFQAEARVFAGANETYEPETTHASE